MAFLQDSQPDLCLVAKSGAVSYTHLIPFAGTTLGAAFVLFMRNNLGEMVQRALTGLAAGVMVAASIWSLLLPAMEQAADMGRWSFVHAVVGFWLGIFFLLGLEDVYKRKLSHGRI